MSNGKLFRLLASRLDKEGECLVLLPVGFRDAVLDGSYRMLWGATWLEDDYKTRATLTNAQWDLIELGISRLIDCVDIKIENNITTNCSGCGSGSNNSGDIVNVDCGGGGGTVNIPIDSPIGGDGSDVIPDGLDGGHLDPESPIPQELIDGGHEDWPSYDAHMCDFAHYVPTALSRILRGVETATDKLTTIAGVLSFIAYVFPSAWAAKAGAATLWELVTAITELVVGETAFDSLEELANDIMSEPLYSELVCIVYTHRYSFPAAHSILLERLVYQISSYAWSGDLEARIQKYLEKSLAARWLYSEMLEQTVGRFETGHDCSSCDAVQGSNIHIDFDVFNPALDWNILGTSYVQDVGGNMVMTAVAHTSGNDGGGGWNNTTILQWAGVGAIYVYRIEMDVRNSSPGNDDTIIFHYGYGAEYTEKEYEGGFFGLSFSTIGWNMGVTLDSADGVEQSLGFRCVSLGQRQSFYIDNIRLYYV